MVHAARSQRIGGSVERISSRSGGLGPVVALVVVAAAPVGLALTIDRTTYDEWGLFVWGPVLLLLSLPLCRWVARRTGEPDLYRFLVGAAFLKIVIGGISRYFVLTEVYGGLGDAIRYDDAAALLVPSFRRGDFTDLGEINATRFIELLTGGIQSVIGETIVGSFLVFSLLGFAGLCLLYVGFCEALPSSNRVLFRRLLFLVPTMWFWPSSIGKDAFLLLCIGATAYGAALSFNGRVKGIWFAALGLWGTITVRPHIALALGIGLLAAVPQGGTRAHGQLAARRRVLAVLLPFAFVAALPTLINATEEFFGIEELSATTAEEVQDTVTSRTDQGGSDFATIRARGPLGLVAGTVTVLGRPFLWEARNLQSIIAALESTVLGSVAAVVAYRRRLDLVRVLRYRLPRFAVVYALAFAVGFAAIANFGILVRQRSLALPFVFVWLAAPLVRRGDGS